MNWPVIILSIIIAVLVILLIILVVFLVRYKTISEFLDRELKYFLNQIERSGYNLLNNNSTDENNALNEGVDIDEIDEETNLDEDQDVKKEKFNPLKIDYSLVELSEDPISLSGFVANINKLVDKQQSKSMHSATVTNWLVKYGYISRQKVHILKEQIKYKATDQGRDIGLIHFEQLNEETGEVHPSYLLSYEAQKFILDNLEIIYLKKKRVSSIDETKDNVGQKWSKKEVSDLINEFVYQKLSITEIARIHRRQTGGIRARLKKLKIID